MVRVRYFIAMVVLGFGISHRAVAQQSEQPSTASPSALSETEQAAKHHFTAATQLYEAGQFQLAANEFEKSVSTFRTTRGAL